jgi:eukaryotic-like serine/threonine-protein kinase
VGASEQRPPGSPPASTGNGGRATPSGAIAGTGPLSALLEELARAPGDALLSAWSHEVRAGDRIGRFRILRELGRGGFGAVYEVEDTELGRHVALKTLRPRRTGQELSADWVKREAEAVARLDHPGIVTLHDVGMSDGSPYLVMELLHGETLAQRLAREPFPPGEAVRVAQEVARGLAHAHSRGILHRDLKPANVFLCDDGRVKLLDFGLAHLLGAGDHAGAGTPGYMAPEQARGEEVDARADVFSAAVTLRESLTGRRADAAGGTVPHPLAKPIADGTAPDRERRPRDGTAWGEALAAARRSMERPRRLARVALAGLVVLALAGSAAFLAWRHGRGSAAHGEVASPSVAVLPFADMSPGRDQEYLADGVAEEVLNGLAQVEGLRVVGRSTAFSYRGKGKKVEEVGRELGVSAVLEGSVRKAGDKVRVNAQLVRTRDASTLWSQAFERNLSDVFALQDEIGRAVVEALAVRLVPGRTAARSGGTTNAEAIQLYLKGRDLLRRGGQEVPRAWEAFEQAVKLDPRFALAWVGIADAVVTLETTMGDHPGDVPARRRRAREAADRAVAIAPGLADAFRARADVHQWLEADWRGQREDLDRARALAPGDPAVAMSNGWNLLAVGRTDEAIGEFERATRIDPLIERGWTNAWLGLGAAAYSGRDRAKVRAAAERMIELFPGYRAFAMSVVAMDRIVAGEAREALPMVAEFRTMGRMGLFWGVFVEALAHHSLGQPAEAARATDEVVRVWGDVGGAYQAAEVLAWQGDADGAFLWLEKARALPDTAMFWLKTDPLLQKIRGDPRWAALLERAGLPPDGAPGARPGLAGATARSEAPAPAPQASVAVLAFTDMSPKHDQEYLADGVAEEILNALGRVPGLKVIGRTSSFSFKGKTDDLRAIGQKLGVANVLEGSVRKDGGKVRIAAKLVRASDGVQLWTESYDRTLQGIFKIQEEIASAVASAMQVKIVVPAGTTGESGQTSNPEAYRSYLLGQYLLRQFSSETAWRAVDAFREAIRIDPGYAASWAGLSRALWTGAEDRPTVDAVVADKRAALAAADRAVALAPRLAMGYAARGQLVVERDFDWSGCFADAMRAVEISPRDADAHFLYGKLLLSAGRPLEAIRELRVATDLDPLSADAWGWLGVACSQPEVNLPADASRAFEKAREINPRNMFASLVPRGAEPAKRRAWAEARLARKVDPKDCYDLLSRVQAHLYLGQRAEALQANQRLIRQCAQGAALQIAGAYCRTGDHRSAAEWLDRAIVQMDSGLVFQSELACFRSAPRDAGGALYEPALKRTRPPPP